MGFDCFRSCGSDCVVGLLEVKYLKSSFSSAPVSDKYRENFDATFAKKKTSEKTPVCAFCHREEGTAKTAVRLIQACEGSNYLCEDAEDCVAFLENSKGNKSL
jgi:hypothetical protein